MNIVTWNCNGALRRKLAEAESLQADVLVVQECEDPALSTPRIQAWAGAYLWVGESKNRGIGIFPRNGNRVEKLNWSGSFSVPGLFSKSEILNWSDEKTLPPCKNHPNRMHPLISCSRFVRYWKMSNEILSAEELGNKLLQSVKEMKSGRAARVRRVDQNEVAEARGKTGLTQWEFAEVLHISPRSLASK